MGRPQGVYIKVCAKPDDAIHTSTNVQANMAVENLQYEAYLLPLSSDRPLATSVVEKYAALRLSALRINPESFGSKWEDQVNYPESKWRELLGTGAKAFIIARHTSANDKNTPEEAWLGLLAVHPPSEMIKWGRDWVENLLPEPPEALEGVEYDAYFLTSIWVHPEHRQRGVARMLMLRAIQWVREDAGLSTDGRSKSDRRVVMALEVGSDNKVAVESYQRMGFVDCGASVNEKGERSMVLVME